MLYAADGSINITTTKDQRGIYSKSGVYQVTDVTASPTVRTGLYAPDGSWNVTILLNENTRTGLYAPNGSLNVVNGAGRGVYSPCGALNVTIV